MLCKQQCKIQLRSGKSKIKWVAHSQTSTEQFNANESVNSVSGKLAAACNHSITDNVTSAILAGSVACDHFRSEATKDLFLRTKNGKANISGPCQKTSSTIQLTLVSKKTGEVFFDGEINCDPKNAQFQNYPNGFKAAIAIPKASSSDVLVHMKDGTIRQVQSLDFNFPHPYEN